MGGATSPKTTFSSTEHDEERKITPKTKPHRVRKSFQVEAGHSIKIITTNFVINAYAYNIQQQLVTPTTLRLNG